MSLRILSLFCCFLAVLQPTLQQCDLEKAEPMYSRAIYNFNLDLASRVAQETSYHFLLSPFLTWNILAALGEGAEDITLAEIKKTLYLHPQNCFNRKYYQLALQIRGEDENSKTGEAIVVDNKFKLKSSFLKALRNHEIGVLTPYFSTLIDAANVINDFTSNSTDGAIDEIVTPEELENKYLLLISAVQYSGKWLTAFDFEIEESPFYDDQGRQMGDVSLMFTEADYHMAEIALLSAQVLDLPYENERFSMYIILPNKGVTLQTVFDATRKISIRSLKKAVSETPTKRVSVQIPRFKLTTMVDNLRELLVDIGLSSLFEAGSAKLPKLSEYDLYVSEVLQKAELVVKEQGLNEPTSINLKTNPQLFIVNKPFLFFIVDKETEVLMFSGAYSRPSLF